MTIVSYSTVSGFWMVEHQLVLLFECISFTKNVMCILYLMWILWGKADDKPDDALCIHTLTGLLEYYEIFTNDITIRAGYAYNQEYIIEKRLRVSSSHILYQK